MLLLIFLPTLQMGAGGTPAGTGGNQAIYLPLKGQG